MSVRKGEPWGRPAAGPPDVTVEGGDADLAAVCRAQPGARVAFRPTRGSDLARALGIAGQHHGVAAHELPIDALRLGETAGVAVNMVVVGTPPDRLRWWTGDAAVTVVVDGRERYRGRATTVVVANGQYLRGADLVPRGHPGDGRGEVQVYALARGERRAMRRRLPQGAHVPHPRIREVSGRRIELHVAGGTLPVEVDGIARGRQGVVTAEVTPAIVRVVV